MAKRRAAAYSDDEGSGSASPTSKRARTEDNENAPQRNGKTRRNVKDEDEDDEDVTMEDGEDDDAQFEQRYTDKVLAAMSAKRVGTGSIADHGIIESIEMHQFMCHKYLTFSFGPQVNFIIGHNGSGKSAVLSAITVALGGKANSTGRANGLKSFIREGQSVSEVTIQLKNQGEEAYKPELYGKSIVITRRFTKDGSSTWKIKSKMGKVMSTKKDDLSAICDHMNIQVDNPMNVLTQDAARQFLSASAPADKYKFFLRGTQLSQLSEEYDTCLENIDHTAKVLNQKKEALPDLRVAYQEAHNRYNEASKARDQKNKAEELKKELAWSYVHKKERELQDAVEEVARQERRPPKVEEGLKAAQAVSDTATQNFINAEEAHENFGGMDDLNESKKKLTDEMRVNRSLLNEMSSERKGIHDAHQATKYAIGEVQRQIDFENKRLASNTQAKRDESQRQVDRANQNLKDAKASLPDIIEKLRNAEARTTELHDEGQAKENDIKTAKEKVAYDESMIRQANAQDKDKFVAYGRNIPELLARINNTRWSGEVPVGPLGVHVKCKEPEKWGDVLRKQLGGMLTAFAVTDPRDSKTLKGMLRASGNEHLLVVIAERDMFDYAAGEPPSDMLTVLRALDISDPYVLRILINQSHIERIFLARTRREGEEMLRAYGRAGVCWSGDGFNLKRFAEGGESTSPMGKGRNDNTSQLLTGRDSAAQRKHFQEQMNIDQAALRALLDEVKIIKSKWTASRTELDSLRGAEKGAHMAIAGAQNQLRQLEEAAHEEMPANVAGLESAKKESEAEKEGLERQFEALNTRKVEVEAKQAGLNGQLEEIRRQIGDFEASRQVLSEAVVRAGEERTKAQHELNYMQNKLVEETTKLERLKEAASVCEEEFKTWTDKALEFCPKVETHRKSEDIDRVLKSTLAALKEREKRDGASVEDMVIELNRAKNAYQTADHEWRSMASLNKALRNSLMLRLARWQEFRRHIALRCKLVFQFNLSHRGYYGKVLFDHVKGTLVLKVQTDDVAATQNEQQGSRDKDPRSLSGGEKSFSTICLLLSLWEAIGCPLRCLDEFDVFMDAVNRRISMKMIIDTAVQSDKKQYVLITPQDMNNITVGNAVRVHRMSDPERGQATLAFSG